MGRDWTCHETCHIQARYKEKQGFAVAVARRLKCRPHTHEQWLFLKHMISRTMTVLFSAAYKDGRIISSMRRYQCVLDKEAIWHRILPFSAQSEGSCWKGSCWTSKCTLLKTLFTLPCRISMTEVWKRNKRHRHAALSTGARITALSTLLERTFS